MKYPCYHQCLDIERAFNLAWHVIPRRALCLNLQRCSCLIGFQLCLLATCSVLPCSWYASWGEHKQRSWETTHAAPKKKKTLWNTAAVAEKHTFSWEFRMETKQNREPITQMIIFVANLPFSLMLLLQQTSTVMPHHWLQCLATYRRGSSLQLAILDAAVLQGRGARTTLSLFCLY